MPILRLMFLLALVLSCSSTPRADLIVYGRVWTGDSANPWAGGIAIRGDTILAVGDSSAVASQGGSDTRYVSIPGGFVTPGFMDDHVHLFTGGFQLTSVDLRSEERRVGKECVVGWSPEQEIRR